MACALLAANASAASYFSPDDKMPPSLMVSGAEEEVMFANNVLIRNLRMTNPTNRASLPPGGGAAISSFFDIFLEVSTGGGGNWVDGLDWDCDSFFDFFPPSPTTPGVHSSTISGLWMTGPDMPANIQIRESPTRASNGSTRIESVPGGYMIDSFFDIFLEVSTDGGGNWLPITAVSHDGGNTWIPDGPNSPAVMRVEGVPEPSTFVLLGMGAVGLLAYAWRRRKRAA
jgi:hypothetical protein